MPEEVRPDQPQPERPNHGQSPRGSSRPSGPDARSDCCDDWRCLRTAPLLRASSSLLGSILRTAAPITAGAIIIGITGRRRQCRTRGFFEAMMRFAASGAGFRERLWREMADAAHYARRDYCDPCAPYPYYCDPCPPPWSYCDPCAPYSQACDPCPPPWSRCDPCPPQYERREGGDGGFDQSQGAQSHA